MGTSGLTPCQMGGETVEVRDAVRLKNESYQARLALVGLLRQVMGICKPRVTAV